MIQNWSTTNSVMGSDRAQTRSRPELQARFVTQWQFDGSAGVAPAQLIFSGVQGRRSALVPLQGCAFQHIKRPFPTAPKWVAIDMAGLQNCNYRHGSSQSWPRYWNGADLRFYFVGSLFSNFNDATIFRRQVRS